MERSGMGNMETWKKRVPGGESRSKTLIAPFQDGRVIRGFSDKDCTIAQGATGLFIPRMPHHVLLILRIKGDTQIFF
jgi:hypothetical protein